MEIKDQSTIFSIAPMDIKSFKPGIYPGTFNIPKCLDENKPERLLIPHPSIHLMAVGGKEKPIQIPTASYTLANSIVIDFLDEQPFADADAHPGICFIQGDVSVDSFLLHHKGVHREMKEAQRKWFFLIVQETDKDWNRHNKNPRVVSDPARYAAKYLNLDKEWNSDQIKTMNMIDCPGCRNKVNPNQAICGNCRVIINHDEYSKLKFAS